MARIADRNLVSYVWGHNNDSIQPDSSLAFCRLTVRSDHGQRCYLSLFLYCTNKSYYIVYSLNLINKKSPI